MSLAPRYTPPASITHPPAAAQRHCDAATPPSPHRIMVACSCNYGETAFISFDALFGTFVATEADAIAHFGADAVKKALTEQFVAQSGESKEEGGADDPAGSGKASGSGSGSGGAARRVRSTKDVKKA